MSEIRRLLARLFTRRCRSCATPVSRYADLCPACIDRLPLERRWAFREAFDGRRHDRTGYRVALTRALAWLNVNPKRREAATATTTVKESS